MFATVQRNILIDSVLEFSWPLALSSWWDPLLLSRKRWHIELEMLKTWDLDGPSTRFFLDTATGPPYDSTMRSGLASVLYGSLPAADLVKWWCVPRSQISGYSQVYTQDLAGNLRDANCQIKLQDSEHRTIFVVYIWGAQAPSQCGHSMYVRLKPLEIISV